MALMLCPECETAVSEYSETCPHCGFPISKYSAANAIIISPIVEQLRAASEGDVIEFGSFTQINSGDCPKTNIQWIIMRKLGNYLMLMSRHCLDYRKYCTTVGKTSWKNGSMRKWLNRDFFESAFSPEEQTLIQTIFNVSQNIEVYHDFTDHTYIDKVFLLTVQEYQNYIPNTEYGAKLTTYANMEYLRHKDTLISTQLNKGNVRWWLHQVEGYSERCPIVGNDGQIGDTVTHLYCGVRPAIWVGLPSTE